MATSIQNIFTAAKLLAILIIVVGGLIKLGEGIIIIVLHMSFNLTHSFDLVTNWHCTYEI